MSGDGWISQRHRRTKRLRRCVRVTAWELVSEFDGGMRTVSGTCHGEPISPRWKPSNDLVVITLGHRRPRVRITGAAYITRASAGEYRFVAAGPWMVDRQ